MTIEGPLRSELSSAVPWLTDILSVLIDLISKYV